jgi:hypothetical protein
MKIYYFEYLNEKNHYVFECFTSMIGATTRRNSIRDRHEELRGEWHTYIIEKIKGVTKKPKLQPPSIPNIKVTEFPISKDGVVAAFKFFKGGRNDDSR